MTPRKSTVKVPDGPFEIKGNLENLNAGDKRKIPIEVILQNGTLLIRFEGSSTEEDGWPIMFEYYDKSICLHVWSDINNPDPTHVIPMEGALEKNRKGGGQK
jgi:hypothetical protein